MTSWFRSWHGAPMDHKWLVVARRAETTPGVVSAIVWALFDYASQASPRGCIAGFDAETYAAYSGFPQETVEAVLCALAEKGIIKANRLTDWEKLQPNQEIDRPSAEVWRVLRAIVFQRDDYTCQYCGVRGARLECDHVVPISQGGSNELDNLITACFTCNRAKHNKTPEEWRR